MVVWGKSSGQVRVDSWWHVRGGEGLLGAAQAWQTPMCPRNWADVTVQVLTSDAGVRPVD